MQNLLKRISEFQEASAYHFTYTQRTLEAGGEVAQIREEGTVDYRSGTIESTVYAVDGELVDEQMRYRVERQTKYATMAGSGENAEMPYFGLGMEAPGLLLSLYMAREIEMDGNALNGVLSLENPARPLADDDYDSIRQSVASLFVQGNGFPPQFNVEIGAHKATVEVIQSPGSQHHQDIRSGVISSLELVAI
ncbi:hypothetical protein COPR103792_04925 [Corynebacterium propinquum]|uniref:hypothetical protein n=1 Tax=Corynebacterium propinquum TaxID=43769 RepID=UPI000363F9FA|nr:hypothetical protein [Corynebacterium propinquum]MDK4319900.1 hypothetical protein [Corynebacterium propinquum]PZQ26456.1 MAG: hypothetical protein DI558_04330 [Corynebacterium propinquum]QQU91574.1 hypothetical protein I6I69_05135 [Corynebacterium propinquum]